MEFIKRAILISFILITVGVLFRGWLFRQLVTYKSIELRKPNYTASNGILVNYINANINGQTDLGIEQIIKLGLSITSKQLNFTADKNDDDPNKLIVSKTAHCVGYASFFATTCNYLLKKQHLEDTWTAKPQVGQLYILGTNFHKYFSSAFYKDHDFVTIENKKTGEIFAVDPTINDYLFIDFVTYKK